MAETSLVFTEEKALKHLANEKWRRDGNSLVSVDSYAPDAVSQYKDALSQETRDTIKLRESADPKNARFNAKKLILDARNAESFFAERGLAISVEAQVGSPQR